MKYIGENAIKKLISLIKGDLATKQPTITASGLLKGDGAGTITAAETQEATLVDVPNGIVKGDGSTLSVAVAGTDYMAPVIGGTAGQVLTKTANGQEWQSINKNNIGLGNVDNVKQYSVDNPPPYPVTSVNGATGEVKGTFYVTVTQGDNYNITADKTAIEVYDAYTAGYAVYAITKFPGMNVPFVLPLVSAVDTGDIILLGFSTIGSLSPDTPPNYPVVAYDGTTGKWLAWFGTLARQGDIPKESFVITFSASGSGSSIIYSCDKTYADILAAYNDGRPLVASIPVYRSGKWSGFWTNDFSYKATAELFSPARFEFSMVYKEDDPDNLDMTAVVARLYSNDEVSIVKLPLQKKLYVSGIVKGAYNGMGGYNYSAAVAGTDYMAPVSGGTAGQVLTKTANGQEWQSINKNNIGLGNVDNVKQYSVDNPPPYPVTSVNGATGEVKGTFYVTVTQGDNNSATADKTAEEVYAAYEAGYVVYAITQFPGEDYSLELPLVSATKMFDLIILGFSTLGSQSPNSNPVYPVVAYDGTTGKWLAWIGTLARVSDIPTIPTALKNPHVLNIKIGNTTTSYDGSKMKTVEIPKGVPSVTTADNGKFLCVVDGAWAAVAYPSAEDGTF